MDKIPGDPKVLREMIREGKLGQPTSGLAQGFSQANLVILPKDVAFDFMLLCQRNPKACPLLEVIEPGQFEPQKYGKGADIRTDISKYRIYKRGKLCDEVGDVIGVWSNDFVSFLIGCSFTFESALMKSGIPLRHWDQGKNVSMYITNREIIPAGKFHGELVVSMRPIHKDHLVKTIQITSRFPDMHGAPIHIGSPMEIGISDLDHTDYGDPVEILEGEVPVFWACGVTPQAVALRSKPSIMITHSPGHMFITDIKDEILEVK